MAHARDDGDLLGVPRSDDPGVVRLDDRVQRTAVRVAMYRALRTAARPPAMALLPRIRPESRLTGATPTRAAMRRWSRWPSSGRSASNVRGDAADASPGCARRSDCARTPPWPRSRCRPACRWRAGVQALSQAPERDALHFATAANSIAPPFVTPDMPEVKLLVWRPKAAAVLAT